MRRVFFAITLLSLTGCGDPVGNGTPTPPPAVTPTPGACTPAPTPIPTPTPVPVACNTRNEQCSTYTCQAEGSPTMLPGSNCQSCHSPGNLPPDPLAGPPAAARNPADNLFWTIAGTAFTDLLGSDGLSNATIKVKDSTGKVVSLTTNRVGNFYSNTAITPPLTAQIISGGQTYEMVSPVDTGACNSCHQCDGSPGGKLYGGPQATPTPEPTPALCVPPTPLPATFSSINEGILQPSCALSNCHGNGSSAGGLSLESSTAYANLVNVSSSQLTSMLLVKPGDSTNSYLWHKLKGDQASVGGAGGKMPVGSTLSGAQLQSVETWILAGAPND